MSKTIDENDQSVWSVDNTISAKPRRSFSCSKTTAGNVQHSHSSNSRTETIGVTGSKRTSSVSTKPRRSFSCAKTTAGNVQHYLIQFII